MSMLEEATNNVAYAKVGVYGTAGSGKTYTSAKLAIGLHGYVKSKKPVAMFDTEPAAAYIIPLFKKAGIKFLVANKSRALKDLLAFMDEAEKTCDIVIIDSITHVWRDVQESYIAKINEGLERRGKSPISQLEFHHWRPIKAAWGEFTDRYLSSRLHVLLCGRAGSIYTYQENAQTGKKELITDGTRMATEKELGHEPSLLLEMVAQQKDRKIVNTAYVLKDRSDSLNGQEIPAPTFETVLLPHLKALNIGGEHFGSMEQRDSKDMFTEEGDDGWGREQRQRAIWCEEVQGLLMKHHPGQSAEEKKAKADLVERVFQTRSWTKVESTNSETIKAGFFTMRGILEGAKADLGDIPDPPRAKVKPLNPKQQAVRDYADKVLGISFDDLNKLAFKATGKDLCDCSDEQCDTVMEAVNMQAEENKPKRAAGSRK